MKKMLLIQPGAFGDIFLCAPIAHWYKKEGYKVYWPATRKFISTLEYFPYVHPLVLSDEVFDQDWLRSDVMKILPSVKRYDKVVNLADRGPHPTAQQFWENFEQCKYRLSGVPFNKKNNLSWQRNEEKEQELFNFLGLNEDEEYAVVHRIDSRNEVAEVPDINLRVIEVREIERFNIPDWFLVFSKAKQIFCIESSIHQFLDGVVNYLPEERFLLKRPSVNDNCRFTVSSHWKLDYIGEKSRIQG